MAKIVLTLEDKIDDDGEMGMTTNVEGADEAYEALQKGDHSVALMVGLTFFRMMEQEVIQRQLNVWCPEEFGVMRMAAMKKKAGVAPENDG